MTVVQTRPQRGASAPEPAGRDTAVDLVRAACVAAVVLLHALMVGVSIGPGGPEFVNAAEGTDWFAPLTWIAQVMPLFFVIGGFAGARAFERLRSRGGTAVDFALGRVHRLLVPAVAVIAAVGAGLGALHLAGAPADLIALAGYRYGQPLWFLGVFLLCQALLPAMHAAHRRAPALAILAPVAGAAIVDAVRAASGIDAVGFLNLALVWLALQQLGFFLADGRIDALRRRTRLGLAAGSVLLIALGVAAGASPNLIEQLNPPTTALLLVGLAQTAVLSLLREPLTRLSRRPRAAAFTRFVTARTMTIYLWHMPVLLVMAGVSAAFAMATGIAPPEPSSAEWWLTRPLWFAVALAATAAAALLLARLEHLPLPRTASSAGAAARAVLLGLAGIVLLLAAGTTVLTAGIAVALLIAALASIRNRPLGATAGATRRAPVPNPAR